MRNVLYITPYFPPQRQVGALRPLKFTRHMRKHGWNPIVLADLWPSAAIASGLTEALPSGLEVHMNYSARAQDAARNARPDDAPSPQVTSSGPSWLNVLPPWLNNPELIPLGEHSVHILHAVRAALEIVRAKPCDAILVNADPYAALLVGAMVARRTGIPLVLDLRDPWSVCELRRSRRPRPIRALVDALERFAVESAKTTILNTETTLRDYRAHYSDLDPKRFACIRNHSDAGLIGHGTHEGFDRYTLLFLGRFRRFVEGTVLLDVLAELRTRGVTPDELQLVVTGACLESTLQRAEELGVRSMLKLHPFVPYQEIGAVMHAADLLVMLSNQTTQRIPAKFYDYALCPRPILSMASNPELHMLLGELKETCSVGLSDVQRAADYVESELHKGRRRTVQRDAEHLSTESATRALCEVLSGAV